VSGGKHARSRARRGPRVGPWAMIFRDPTQLGRRPRSKDRKWLKKSKCGEKRGRIRKNIAQDAILGIWEGGCWEHRRPIGIGGQGPLRTDQDAAKTCSSVSASMTRSAQFSSSSRVAFSRRSSAHEGRCSKRRVSSRFTTEAGGSDRCRRAPCPGRRAGGGRPRPEDQPTVAGEAGVGDAGISKVDRGLLQSIIELVPCQRRLDRAGESGDAGHHRGRERVAVPEMEGAESFGSSNDAV